MKKGLEECPTCMGSGQYYDAPATGPLDPAKMKKITCWCASYALKAKGYNELMRLFHLRCEEGNTDVNDFICDVHDVRAVYGNPQAVPVLGTMSAKNRGS